MLANGFAVAGAQYELEGPARTGDDVNAEEGRISCTIDQVLESTVSMDGSGLMGVVVSAHVAKVVPVGASGRQFSLSALLEVPCVCVSCLTTARVLVVS